MNNKLITVKLTAWCTLLLMLATLAGAWVGSQAEASDFPLLPSGATPTQPATETWTPTSGYTATYTPTSTHTPNAVNTPTATSTLCPLTFTDVHPADYFYTAVRYLYCADVISGYADNTFRPYNQTTRGQMCKIIVLAEGWALGCTSTPHFGDVYPDNPFYCFIQIAFERSVVSGYGDGTFRPGNNVTRGQTCKMVAQAERWELICPQQPHFSDVPRDNPFYCFVETAYAADIISGYEDGTFRPDNDVTRGQLSKIVYSAVGSRPPPVRCPTVTSYVYTTYAYYNPDVIIIPLGGTITWVNHSFEVHTIISDAGLFKGAVSDKGGRWSFTFGQPGSYGYYYRWYPNTMRGVVIVMDGCSTPTVTPTFTPTITPTYTPTYTPILATPTSRQ